MKGLITEFEIECPNPDCEELLLFEVDYNEILITDDEECPECGAINISEYISEAFYGGP